ncbi:MAG: ABC transporter, ATP-binding protein (cluster 5, nickel/peptides/opines) / ABC transporter, ATP-binding protein (cluster 5, nickel/peptides/opines), partial [uncultured Microvirga sp.]
HVPAGRDRDHASGGKPRPARRRADQGSRPGAPRRGGRPAAARGGGRPPSPHHHPRYRGRPGAWGSGWCHARWPPRRARARGRGAPPSPACPYACAHRRRPGDLGGPAASEAGRTRSRRARSRQGLRRRSPLRRSRRRDPGRRDRRRRGPERLRQDHARQPAPRSCAARCGPGRASERRSGVALPEALPGAAGRLRASPDHPRGAGRPRATAWPRARARRSHARSLETRAPPAGSRAKPDLGRRVAALRARARAAPRSRLSLRGRGHLAPRPGEPEGGDRPSEPDRRRDLPRPAARHPRPGPGRARCRPGDRPRREGGRGEGPHACPGDSRCL